MQQMQMRWTTWAILAMFIIGLLFTMTYTSKNVREAFDGSERPNPNRDRCPNLLIQKGSKLYLHNSRLANVPGVNPLKFNNLEDYVEFTDWQRGQGIRCPILYLQHSFDAQGKPVYKIRPSPLNLQGGLPPVASSGVSPSNANANFIDDADKPPMNAGSANGQTRKLKGLSANPMDPNWGGDAYTQAQIDAGKYAGDEVSIYVP